MAWHIWKDNIKMDLNELWPDDADRICLSWEENQWLAVMKVVMEILGSTKGATFLD